MTRTAESYVCIHCGAPSDRLYVKYGSDLLKLTRCSDCGQLVDEYIETEFSVVFVDTVLQKLEAYRHLIFNAGIKRSWKLALLFLLGEALELWLSEHYVGHPERSAATELELEWRFYLTCLLLVASNALFVLLVVSALCLRQGRALANGHTVRSLIVGGYGKMLGLPAVLWNCDPKLTRYVVTAFFLLSEVQACRAASGSGKRSAVTIVLTSYALSGLVLGLLRMTLQ